MLVAVPLLVVFLPKAFNDYFNYRLAFVGIYFIAIVGLNVLTGYNGQISLGHGAFMAIGAYTTAILNVNYGVGLYWTIPIAGILTGLFGFAFGFPALRLAGVYLALATFGLAVSVPLVAKRFEGFTGGGQGKTVALPSSPIGGLTSNQWISYLTWAIAGGDVRRSPGSCSAATWDGRSGRCATPRSPRSSSGVSLARYKTLAFGIAAAYAGVAGALLTIAIAFVNPDTFPVSLSILLLTGAVVGGLGSLEGMLFGAIFIQFAPGWGERLAKHVHYNEATTQSTVFYGLILLLVLFVMPGGAAQLIHQLGTGLKRLRLWLYSRADSRATA